MTLLQLVFSETDSIVTSITPSGSIQLRIQSPIHIVYNCLISETDRIVTKDKATTLWLYPIQDTYVNCNETIHSDTLLPLSILDKSIRHIITIIQSG